jgi:8-oxo-dGTP pyrophosphatase MutT (NUDIX family)
MFRAAVYIIIENRDGRVLTLRRYNTGWSDGMYTLPAGHVDAGESVADAAVRELKEETSLEVDFDNIRFVHIMQRESDAPYFDFYFETKLLGDSVPKIMEPEKCDDLQWVDISKLGGLPLLKNVKIALENIKKGMRISYY